MLRATSRTDSKAAVASGSFWRSSAPSLIPRTHHEYAVLVEGVEPMQSRRSFGMIAQEGGVQSRLTLRAEADKALQGALGGITPDAADTSKRWEISRGGAA